MTPLEQAAQKYAEKIRPITGLDKHDAPFITAFEHNGDIEEAFKEGANWQASQGWISVKERLPDHVCNVIVLKNNGITTIMSFHTPFCSGKRKFQWWGFGTWLDQHSQVTHWMLLPQPPKQD